MFRSRIVCALLLVVCVLAASGCSNSQVRLRYLPNSEMIPVTMKHNIGIGLVQFADKRSEPSLGMIEGKQFMPVSNIAAWVSHGLEDQLMRHGVSVSYVLNHAQITTKNWVSGQISQLTIKRLIPGKFKGEITLKIAVNNGLPTTYKASLVKQGVPYTNIIEPLLAELLNDVLNAAVPELLAEL